MDFEYFMGVVRSEDEACNQAEWQRIRTKLAASPVTPSLTLKDIEPDREEVDLTQYLSPQHFKIMVAKLTETQLSNLVIRLMCTITCVEIR